MANAAYKQTGSKRLCMAGGVALNSKANGRLMLETPFEHIFIQPAAGDDGGALGAALYAYHILLGKPRRFVQEHNFYGAGFSQDEVLEAITAKGYPFRRIDDDEVLIQNAVEDILSGKVISLFQGRAEWGPRALGNRSILADPRRDDMKEIVNSKIKFREPFRPFAPVILENAVDRFFPEIKNALENYPLRYMLVISPWDETLGQQVPAVNHLGTGRLQTIRKQWNPRYYRMVERFDEETGVPVLMNTSFNLRGEPIVNTPANALNTFSNSGIDSLYIENYIVRKPN
jgi:carbamoyltransferase